ncbi:hypothetical protein CKN61_12810 [Carnobacterium divergens]|uniref:hypothetical protein n=1 Tax=Carnobacterium divergens TaxID=2748 RepID=UPI0010735531|nr:hypothetical protein [Carnobacterium divergens]TFI86920.1 hypothetical protein CKN61_12810 [Carnobacterium divergens]
MTVEFISDNGEKKSYGALTTMSRWSKNEWLRIYKELVKRNHPELFETIKDNDVAISAVGYGIDLEERYEALLEELPQSSYSKAGTHPKWVSDAVEENTLDKGITQDDVKDILNSDMTSDEKLADIKEYLEIK